MELVISDTLNQEVYQQQINANTKYIDVDLTPFNNGIYQCVIVSELKKYMQKIVVLK